MSLGPMMVLLKRWDKDRWAPGTNVCITMQASPITDFHVEESGMVPRKFVHSCGFTFITQAMKPSREFSSYFQWKHNSGRRELILLLFISCCELDTESSCGCSSPPHSNLSPINSKLIRRLSPTSASPPRSMVVVHMLSGLSGEFTRIDVKCEWDGSLWYWPMRKECNHFWLKLKIHENGLHPCCMYPK